MQNIRIVAAMAVSCGLGGVVENCMGQWTVTNLHPSGALNSWSYGVHGNRQAGAARMTPAVRASVWFGAQSSWTDITPLGSEQAYCSGVWGTQVTGWFAVGGGLEHAGLWTNTGMFDLNPIGSFDSKANGTDGAQQVGHAWFGGVQHAGLWAGDSTTWVDLHPPGCSMSNAVAVSGGVQGGVATIDGVSHASIWRGTAASWTTLNSPGAESGSVYAIDGLHQAGHMSVGDHVHASVWSGTPATRVDLHPPHATAHSFVFGMYRGQQVGNVDVNGRSRACLWTGSVQSFEDLHSFLPANFQSSTAMAIHSDGSTLYVVGHGFNTATNRNEALMWSRPLCGTAWFTAFPSDADLIPGTPAQFTVSVEGADAGYQWRKNGSPLSNGTKYSGVNSAMLTVANVNAGDEGSYDCVITTTCNTAQSGIGTLSCDPILTAHPAHRAFLDPGGVQLSVSVPAGASYTYRWRQDGQNLFNIPGVFNGVTTRTLTIASDDPSLEGVYDVVVTNACGVVTSLSAEVRKCFADYNDDGDVGTDADIEDFFRCLGGSCCPVCSSDYNRDGDFGTDADIEAFFRVLGGGAC